MFGRSDYSDVLGLFESPSASQLSCSIPLLMFPIGSCHQRFSFVLRLSCVLSSGRSPLMLAGKLGGVRLSSLVHQVEDSSGMPEHTLRKLSEEVLDYPSSSLGRGFCSPE